MELGAGDPLLRAWLKGGRRRGGARLFEEVLRERGLSWGGESPNMSSKEVDVLSEVLFPAVLNRNGGALLSGVGRFIPSWKDAALLLARLGRRNPGRRLLQTVRSFIHRVSSVSYSGGAIGASMGDACRGLGASDGIGESRGEAIGLPYGDGECTSVSVVTTKAGL